LRSCGLSLFSIYIYCSYYLTCPLYLFKRFYSKTSKEDKYSNEYKKEYELTEEQKEVLIGFMLADGFLDRVKPGHNARLRVDPYYVTGFSFTPPPTGGGLGEASFMVYISKNKNCKTGWRVSVEFCINLHTKDKALLKQIQSFFGGIGKIYESSESCRIRVHTPKDLTKVIIPHFEKYPLITQKRADFELFKMIVELINQKEHITVEGLNKIMSIKASLNKGLSAFSSNGLSLVISNSSDNLY
jgi:hypothetical protein